MAKVRFHQMLEAKLTEALSKRAEEIASGIPVDKYREEVGYCRGLREALKLCDEVEREFE